MEEPLLLPENQSGERNPPVEKCAAFAEELKNVGYLAAPMAAVSVAQYLLQVVSVMVAGHLGELSLSGVAIATSFTNVTGFSILAGSSGALETLCGQAYGAKQYRKLGTYTYSAVISLIPICLLISLLWSFMDKLLISIGQDPEISKVACEYAVWLIPALFSHAFLQPMIRYFQCQGLTLPLLISSFVTLCVHVPVCWVLVFRLGLGSNGAALAIGLSYWLNVAMLVLYLKFSSYCEKTRGFVLSDFLSSVKEFFRYAIPSAAMICFEWWSFELLILLSGLLPNSKLETSVLSICLTTSALHYVIPFGIAAAGSTRVSTELGAGNPQAARLAVCAVIFLVVIESVIASTVLFCCRNVFGYAYSNSNQVVNYVSEISPLLCLSFILDGVHAVLSGVARGSGWQNIGACANAVAYYLVGVPIGILLCFVLHLRGKGLWSGVVIGSALQGLILALVTAFTNWKDQAVKARKRIISEASLASNALA